VCGVDRRVPNRYLIGKGHGIQQRRAFHLPPHRRIGHGDGSGFYRSRNRYYGNLESIPRPHTRATITTRSGSATLRILDTAARAELELKGERRRTSDSLEPGDVLEWMAAAGVDTGQAAAAYEAAAIATLIRNVVVGGGDLNELHPGGGLAGLTSVRMTTDRTYWPQPLIIVIFGVVWLGLMLELVRWRRGGPGQRRLPVHR
jgi:hypothetical protein